MKYMIDYLLKSSGEYEDNLENAAALQRAFATWKPEDGLNVLAFVSNVANTGGYVLVDAADPKVVFSFVSKFSAWAEPEVVPVIDIGDAVALGTASLEWAQTASED